MESGAAENERIKCIIHPRTSWDLIFDKTATILSDLFSEKFSELRKALNVLLFSKNMMKAG